MKAERTFKELKAMEATLTTWLPIFAREGQEAAKAVAADPDNMVLRERLEMTCRIYTLIWDTLNADELADRWD